MYLRKIIIGNIWELSGKTNKQRNLKSQSLLITSYCLKETGKQRYCEQKWQTQSRSSMKIINRKKSVVPFHYMGFSEQILWSVLLDPFTEKIFQVFTVHFRLCSENKASHIYVAPYNTSCFRSSLILALPHPWFSYKDFLNDLGSYTELAFFFSVACRIILEFCVFLGCLGERY